MERENGLVAFECALERVNTERNVKCDQAKAIREDNRA
jgi:hypothetical protein